MMEAVSSPEPSAGAATPGADTPGTSAELREINRRLYDAADDAIWTKAVYETVHGGWAFANIGGRVVLDHLGELAGLDADSRVLEVGCGSGAPCLYLAERFGCQVVGIDLNERQIERARRAAAQAPPEVGQRLELAAADLLTWQAEQPFDLVFTLDVLMLVAEVVPALRAMVRSAAPDGQLVLAEILAGPELRDDLRRLAIEEDGMVHLPTLEEYDLWLAEAGAERTGLVDRTGLAVECFEGILGGLSRYRDELESSVGETAAREWVRVSERYRAGFADGELRYAEILARPRG